MIYAYQDMRKWGEMLVEAGKRKGVPVSLFKNADEVPNNGNHTVFVHMNHRPKYREANKKMMEQLAKKDVTLIPTPLEARLYDDKVAQYELLHEHMPKSYFIKSEREAMEAIEKLNYPFISKSATGAGSSNVRLIKNESEAINEIKLAFGPGIPLYFNQKQKGYLFWQHFCQGNEGDWRVYIIAKKYVCLLRRYNRKNLPFASGSPNREIVNRLDDFTKLLIDKAYSIANTYNFNLCAMDFVTDNGDLKLVETSVGWVLEIFKEQEMYYRENYIWQPSNYISTNFFDLVIDSILNGEFT